MSTFQVFLKNGNTFQTNADKFKCISPSGSHRQEIVFYIHDRPLSDMLILASEVAAIVKSDDFEKKEQKANVYQEDYFDHKF